ncbi:MAG: GtrA family protein [Solirubrobacteraceae bacterium]
MLSEARLPRTGAPSAAQGLRFAASGAFVALVYVAITSLLAEVVGIPFEMALAIGFGAAITTHFTLQRVFVWRHADGFALSVQHQLVRYLLLAGVQYGATAAATATLPHLLGAPTEDVYLATAALLSAASFLIFRTSVFHSVAQESTQK